MGDEVMVDFRSIDHFASWESYSVHVYEVDLFSRRRG